MTDIHYSSEPLVSVVIPAHNAADTIENTIHSVLAQTYTSFEIIVVDDGSLDETSRIVAQLRDQDPRIRLAQQENRGVAAARNLGITQSRGEYVAPLDADDLWLPEKLRKQVEVMRQSSPIVGLVSARSMTVFSDGRSPIASRGWSPEGAVFLPMILGNFIGHASAPLIRRCCFDDVGMYNSAFWEQGAQGCEDWDLYLRIAERYEFREVPEYLVGYLQSTETMSARWQRMDDSYRLLIHFLRQRHPEIPGFVFRWSKASYLLYLANKAVTSQQFIDALVLLSRASALDPFLASNRRLWRLFAKSLSSIIRRSPRHARRREVPPNIYLQTNLRADDKALSSTASAMRLRRRITRLTRLQNELGLGASERTVSPLPPPSA